MKLLKLIAMTFISLWLAGFCYSLVSEINQPVVYQNFTVVDKQEPIALRSSVEYVLILKDESGEITSKSVDAATHYKSLVGSDVTFEKPKDKPTDRYLVYSIIGLLILAFISFICLVYVTLEDL